MRQVEEVIVELRRELVRRDEGHADGEGLRVQPDHHRRTPGEKFTITFKNDGSAEHNFSITSLKVNQDLEAGKTATVTFTAPSTAGDVQYFCEYHKDSKNMVGTLHVA